MIDLKDKTILIVDDEKDYVEAIADEFTDYGCNILKAYNGQEAFVIVKSGVHIDLVISDIRMPVMDGKELLTKIKDNDPFTPVIIFITGHSDLLTHEAYHLGTEAIFAKPFKMNLLVEAVRRLLTPFESRLSIPLKQKSELILTESDGHAAHIGRGGVAFCTAVTNLKVGQEISFKLRFENKNDPALEGDGIIRWAVKSHKPGCNAFIGVEFYYLPENDRVKIETENRKKKCKPYIPST